MLRGLEGVRHVSCSICHYMCAASLLPSDRLTPVDGFKVDGITNRSGVRMRVEPPAKAVSVPSSVEKAGLSVTGLVRTKNEDHFFVATHFSQLQTEASSLGTTVGEAHPLGVLAIVADGMGGYGGGEIASALTTSYVARHLPAIISQETPAMEQRVDELARRCVDQLYQAAEQQEVDPRLGTTLTAAYLTYPAIYLMHAGDSRAYLSRRGRLRQLTRDHTVERHLLDNGLTSQPNGVHLLTNAIGGGTREVQPDLIKLDVVEGDTFMLCTDGLSRSVSEQVIARELASNAPVRTIAQRLIDRANEQGSPDNVTVVVLRVPVGNHVCMSPTSSIA